MSEKFNNYVTRWVHEFFFSLNVSFILTAFGIYGPGAWFNWDLGLKFVTINWLFPPMATICLWILLRIFGNVSLTLSILRSVAGILAIGAAPLWFLARYAEIDLRHPWIAFQYVGFYEAVVALWCTGLYLKRRWPLPGWAYLLMLLAHHTFWLWQFRGYIRGYLVELQSSLHYAWQERSWLMRTLEVLKTLFEWGWNGWGAVIALMPVIALLSGLAWALYLSSRKRLV